MNLTTTWRIKTMVSLAILLLCLTSAQTIMAGPLPNPKLAFTGSHPYVANGQTWVRYNLRVINWTAYPNGMFAPAPNLPACGNNTKSSRTWVDIYNASNGQRLYGFCALGSSQDLTKLWFSVNKDEHPPAYVYITMTDRRTHAVYKSNRVAVH